MRIVKMPTTSIFLFSRLILNIIEQNTAKQFLDLEKMQFFIIFENFLSCRLLAHCSHQSSLALE